MEIFLDSLQLIASQALKLLGHVDGAASSESSFQNNLYDALKINHDNLFYSQ